MKASALLIFLVLVAIAKSTKANIKPKVLRYRDSYGNIRTGVLQKQNEEKFSILPILSSSESSQQSDSDSEYLTEDISAYLHEYSRRIGPHKNADSIQEMYNISEEKLLDAEEKFAGVDDNSPDANHRRYTYSSPKDSSSSEQVYNYKQSPHVIRPEGQHIVVNSKPIYVNPPPLVVHQKPPKTCNPVISYQPPDIKVQPKIVMTKKPCKKTQYKIIKSSVEWDKKDSRSNEYQVYYRGIHKHHHHEPSHSISASDEKNEKPIWTYGQNDPYGPSNWGKIAAACDGDRQSPIALFTHNAKYNGDAKPLKIKGLDLMPTSLMYENDADSFNLKFNYPKGKKVQISGGPLKIPYILDSVHWHWGKHDQAGSEHTLNAKRYSAELHLVFYNSNYESLSEAIKTPKGLAVLGILYELDDYADNPWAAYAKRVIKDKSTYTEKKNLFPLRELVQDDDFNVLSYKGSLTNPDCQENVTWMVSTKPLGISSSDLEQFRKLKDLRGLPLLKNFRPLQSRNGRVITEYN